MSGSLFLIGPRGSGKSTVGRLLSQRLALPFFDADEFLEAKIGRSIGQLVSEDGEPAFRALEEHILMELIDRGPAVVATGGGVVLREVNRQRLRSAGKAVWLTADVHSLWQRLSADPATDSRRPKLSVGGLTELEEQVRQREQLYRECANLIVPTVGRSPDQITADILAAWSTLSSSTA
jgi:shikimate kinase